MSNVERKLNNIRLMQKGRIPKEYQLAGCSKKYQSGYEKYNVIYKEIDECSEQELNNLEILLENGIESAKSLENFKGVLPLAVSIFTIFFSVHMQSLSAFLASNINLKVSLEMILSFINNQYTIMGIIFVLIMMIYLFLDLMSNKAIRQDQYLLYILRVIKKKREMV
ncbi:MAG: hypothetical protein HDR02_15070 [Lachnospiraceae bacterium]|nr:hypothetical protein [Lachnospiraceae bacterium]